MSAQRLAGINTKLEKLGLRPLKSLGSAQAGTPEIVGIAAIYDFFANLFIDVVFDTVHPDDSSGQYAIRFNRHSDKGNSAVFVVLINKSLFALVRQWRTSQGEFTVEVARGFRNPEDTSDEFTVRRELKEEVLNGGTIDKITLLKQFAEQNGTHNVVSSIFLVEATVPEELLTRVRGTDTSTSTQLWTRGEIDTVLDSSALDGRLGDNHSLTAILLALRYLDRAKQ